MAKNISIKCIVDFPNVFTPKKIMNQGEPVYSATLIIPKDSHNAIEAIDFMCSALVENDKRLKGQSFVRFPLIDGDTANSEGESYPERYHNSYILRAKTNFAPTVYEMDDTKKYIELDESTDKVYAGMEAIVNINLYVYSVGGNRGIAVGLGDMCVTGNGEPFYTNSPEEKFDTYL